MARFIDMTTIYVIGTIIGVSLLLVICYAPGRDRYRGFKQSKSAASEQIVWVLPTIQAHRVPCSNTFYEKQSLSHDPTVMRNPPSSAGLWTTGMIAPVINLPPAAAASP